MAQETRPRRKRQPPSRRRQFPVVTIAFYGPDDKTPTKIAVGIIDKEGEEPIALQRWAGPNVASDPQIQAEIKAFIQEHKAKSVVMTEGVIGCPHEEGIDYPLGEDCPFCPFWEGKQ
ncbi:MAG: hypothetical protein E3J21_17415 [Anaerolineales bacterium]|nr:MAG: hypothetical protein E3J21_17415 [Anaerolineales bacterium]